MKKKLLTMTAMALMTGYVNSASAFGIPTNVHGVSVWGTVLDHLVEACNPFTAAVGVVDNWAITFWGDPGMWVATGIDILATSAQKGKTVDAKKAIKQLKEALGDEEGGKGSGGGSPSTADATTATVFAPELVLTQLNITKKDGASVFNGTREAVEYFLYKTVDNECSGSARDCNIIRQNKWLLASVTLAAATSDKILSLTANQETVRKDGTKGSKKGTTSLIKHFQQLAKEFNEQTTPTGMYNIMAEMVLDTHRQVNEANVLMARDLEMQGLGAVRETEVTGLSRSGSETEG